MFWNRKKVEAPDAPLIAARTIPAEFYGGANPQVAFKTVTKEIPLVTTPSEVEKKLLHKATAVGSGERFHPARLLTQPRFLIIAGSALFVLALGFMSWYYWYQAHKITSQSAPQTIPVDIETTTATQTIETIVGESTTTNANTTNTAVTQPPSLSDTRFTFPSTILGVSKDSDKDTLTDAEEELFKTDVGLADTDNDGYPDDLEIDNLYNPAGRAPVRLVDAGTVKEFTNPVFNYQILYPVSWAGGMNGNVDPNYRDVLFSTLTGENIEIKVFDKDTTTQSFADWFAIYAPTERFQDLVKFTSYYKVAGYKRTDGLVYYFEHGNRVYVIGYHTTHSAVVNYPTIIKLMARSFHFSVSDTDAAATTTLDATLVEPVTTTTVIDSSSLNTTTSI